MYNVQIEGAHRVLAEYQSIRPDDPLGPVFQSSIGCTYCNLNFAVGVENYLLSLKPAADSMVFTRKRRRDCKHNGLEKLSLTAEHGHYP